MLNSYRIAPVAVPRGLDPADAKTDAGAAAAVRAMVPSARGVHLHLNPADVGLYDEDTGKVRLTLVDLLRTPKAWSANKAAWLAQMKPGHRHLEYAKSLAPGYAGVSIEGEQLCPVGHDERPWEAWVRAYPTTGRERYGEALTYAMGEIGAAVGVRVVPYGAAQIIPAHIRPTSFAHGTELGCTVEWYGNAGPFSGIRSGQQFYMPYPTLGPNRMLEWVNAALSIQWAIGHARTLTVFLNAEIDGAPGSGEADEFPEMDPGLMSQVLGAIHAHHASVDVVQWFKVGTPVRAQRWAWMLRYAGDLTDALGDIQDRGAT